MTDTDTSRTGGTVASTRHEGRADLLAGSAFLVLGLAFGYGATGYELGSALNMGPGYLPLVLGGLLAGLGLVILVQGGLALRREPAGPAPRDAEGEEPATDEPGPVPWVRGGLVLASVVVFAVTVSGLGLGPALFLTTLLAALAGHRNTPLKAAVIAAALTGLCLLVFVVVLQLRMPVVGVWLGG